MATAALRKSDLTPRQKYLVERIQRLRYGRIENLVVRDGDPIFERGTTKVKRSINFEFQNDPHPDLDRDDTVLKAKVVNMLECLAAFGDGVVEVIHVAGGLPAKMEIDEDGDDEPGCAARFVASPTRPPVRHAAVDKIQRR